MILRESIVEKVEADGEDASTHIEAVIDTCRKWLYMPDDVPLKVILATVLTAKEPGDPLWMFVVGPPGDLKTELLRTLGIDTDYVRMITNATPKSLLSGLSKEDGGEDLDLLPKIDGKTLVIRDFTTILSKRPEQVSELFGRLRTYFDGEYSDNWGSIGNKSGESHFNLIAAVTPSIDRCYPANQKLGERFLKVRTDTDEEMAAEYAARNAGHEDEMRKELKNAVQQFLCDVPRGDVTIFDDVKNAIQKMARFLAFLRTPVSRDHSGNVIEWPQPEKPPRLVKQLIKMATGLAVVNRNVNVGQEELAVLNRIVWDTAPPMRHRILGAYHSPQDSLSHTELQGRTKLPKSTLSRQLEDLQLVGVLDKHYDGFCFSKKARGTLGLPWV